MTRRQSKNPTDAELEILTILWRDGASGLGHICNELNKNRKVAKTTVATVLKVMLEKKLVTRQDTEHGYAWNAKVGEAKVKKGLVQSLLETAFDGSPLDLVSHLISSQQLTQNDRRKIQNLFKAHQQDREGRES